MVELLPCPFCGGAGVLEAVFPLDGGKFWAVHCRNCRMIGPFTPANVTEKIAVELWNQRVTLHVKFTNSETAFTTINDQVFVPLKPKAHTLLGLPIVEVDEDLGDASQIVLGPPLI